jgi:hypothetical protein
MRGAHQHATIGSSHQLQNRVEDRALVATGERRPPADDRRVSEEACIQRRNGFGIATGLAPDRRRRELVQRHPARRYNHQLDAALEHRPSQAEIENRKSLLGIGTHPHDRRGVVEIVDCCRRAGDATERDRGFVVSADVLDARIEMWGADHGASKSGYRKRVLGGQVPTRDHSDALLPRQSLGDQR